MENFGKIKSFFRDSDNREKILTVGIIFLVGMASFGLGRLSALESGKVPVNIENIPLQAQVFKSSANSRQDITPNQGEKASSFLKEGGMLVGSKNSDKYHLPWCSGAKRIKEENKIYFSSVEEAKAKGYTPAGNCKGLE
jgi:hypothetical protein